MGAVVLVELAAFSRDFLNVVDLNGVDLEVVDFDVVGFDLNSPTGSVEDGVESWLPLVPVVLWKEFILVSGNLTTTTLKCEFLVAKRSNMDRYATQSPPAKLHPIP